MEYNQSYVKVSIEIEENNWGIEEKDLFEVVIRKNKKRSFLFASKVLGKYLAVHPYTPQVIGMMLAEALKAKVENRNIASRMKELSQALKMPPNQNRFKLLKEEQLTLEEETLFIGFAETATALGHSVFSAFQDHCAYLHTTRAPIVEESPSLYFKEEHSHAVDHTCFIKNFEGLHIFKRIVLVDDEITTGKTALNLIRAISEKTSIKEFAVLSLLDWRSLEDIKRYEQLEEELGIRIQSVALLKGKLSVVNLQEMDNIKLNNEKIEWLEKKEEDDSKWEEIKVPLDQKINLAIKGKDCRYSNFEFMERATGRFGLTNKEHKLFEKKAYEIGSLLRKYRKYKNCLCLGTEEFIYWPCMIASHMGEGVRFACSARSPIVTLNQSGYAIKDAICFENPEDTALLSYIYNLEERAYEEVFWFLERNICDTFKLSICKALKARGIKEVYFVIL